MTDTPLPMTERQRRQSQIKLLAIFAVAGVPVLLAFAMFYLQIGVPLGTTNEGELVAPPLPFAELPVSDAGLLAEYRADTESPGWRLMLATGSDCAEPCQALLHRMRQVNVALGKDSDRVSRLLLSEQTATAVAALQTTYPQMRIGAWQASTSAATVVEKSTIYIVDPLGNIMMKYRPDQEGKAILHDLKRLLKVSKIG